MADLGKNFATLPIDQLICAPILAVAQGQAELCRVYLDNLFTLAYKKDNAGKGSGEINSVKFTLNRMVLGENGETAPQQFEVEAPLLVSGTCTGTDDGGSYRTVYDGNKGGTDRYKQIFIGSVDGRRIFQMGIPCQYQGKSYHVFPEYPYIRSIGQI